MRIFFYYDDIMMLNMEIFSNRLFLILVVYCCDVNSDHYCRDASTTRAQLAERDEEDTLEDEEAIMIKVIKPSPHGSSTQLNNEETPLLDKTKADTAV